MIVISTKRVRRQRQLLSWLSTLVVCSMDLQLWNENRADTDLLLAPYNELINWVDERSQPPYYLQRYDSSSSSDDNNVIKVYSPTNSTSNVAACIMVKNETLYLDEWMDFHIALGFSPIYIYDNSEDFELMLGSHKGIYSWYDTRSDIWEHIRLFHFPTIPRKMGNGLWVKAAHDPAFERCIKHDAINSTYAALLDADEYLVLKTQKFDNVVDLMDHYCPTSCGQLSFNWRTMGISNQRQYTPVPVTKRNVNWNPWEAQEGFVKAIVRPTYVADDTRRYVHVVDLKRGEHLDTTGHRVKVVYKYQNKRTPPPTDVAVLFHYGVKSVGEFQYKTCVKKRDDVDNFQFCTNKQGKKQKGKYFAVYNGTIFDDSAWRQLTRMVPRYRRFGEAANVTYDASEMYASWLESQK